MGSWTLVGRTRGAVIFDTSQAQISHPATSVYTPVCAITSTAFTLDTSRAVIEYIDNNNNIDSDLKETIESGSMSVVV